MVLKNKNDKHTPQWLKPISQYALYAAMFCPLHSSISIEQHKSTSAIHSDITENTENSLAIHALHVSMCESHNPLISEISNSFDNIIAVRSVSVIFVSRTEAITQIVTYTQL